MKNIVLSLILLSFSATAWSQNNEPVTESQSIESEGQLESRQRRNRRARRFPALTRRVRRVCQNAGLTPEKRLELRASAKAFRQETQPLRAQLRSERKAYRQLVKDSNATEDQILTQSEKTSSALEHCHFFNPSSII